MDKWKHRNRPSRLEKRFEFESYNQTRDFLDALGKQCELENHFPDISFGKTYVNITLRPEEDAKDASINDSDFQFANKIDDLLN
tara:strand:- start:244 stop:495 length:252 start_codon:yes stop_codon:yes gene_type:complete